MAKFYVIRTIRFGVTRVWAGSVVDDAVVDVAALRAAGAELWDVSDPDAAALAVGSAQAQAVRAQGGDEQAADHAMQAAVNLALGGGSSGGNHLGGIFIRDGSTPQTINIAPALLGNWLEDYPSVGDVVPDHANGRILVNKDGIYKVFFSVSGTLAAARIAYLHVYRNAAEAAMSAVRRGASGGVVPSIGGSTQGILQLTKGDALSLYAQSDADAQTLTILEASLTCVRHN